MEQWTTPYESILNTVTKIKKYKIKTNNSDTRNLHRMLLFFLFSFLISNPIDPRVSIYVVYTLCENMHWHYLETVQIDYESKFTVLFSLLTNSIFSWYLSGKQITSSKNLTEQILFCNFLLIPPIVVNATTPLFIYLSAAFDLNDIYWGANKFIYIDLCIRKQINAKNKTYGKEDEKRKSTNFHSNCVKRVTYLCIHSVRVWLSKVLKTFFMFAIALAIGFRLGIPVILHERPHFYYFDFEMPKPMQFINLLNFVFPSNHTRVAWCEFLWIWYLATLDYYYYYYVHL